MLRECYRGSVVRCILNVVPSCAIMETTEVSLHALSAFYFLREVMPQRRFLLFSRRHAMTLNNEQRSQLLAPIADNREVPRDFQHLLFPPERREYELVYADKEREADILVNTMAVPLQQVSAFGAPSAEWHNLLIFGDNLQIMARLLEMPMTSKRRLMLLSPIQNPRSDSSEICWNLSTCRLTTHG